VTKGDATNIQYRAEDIDAQRHSRIPQVLSSPSGCGGEAGIDRVARTAHGGDTGVVGCTADGRRRRAGRKRTWGTIEDARREKVR